MGHGLGFASGKAMAPKRGPSEDWIDRRGAALEDSDGTPLTPVCR
jgi:hypothetical protein